MLLRDFESGYLALGVKRAARTAALAVEGDSAGIAQDAPRDVKSPATTARVAALRRSPHS
jgi:hypothetical protein